MSMNWFVLTPHGQKWLPYGMFEGDVLLHWEGADTDMSDSTMGELLAMFGDSLIVREK